jgi:arylsulfatase A-like enzyme
VGAPLDPHEPYEAPAADLAAAKPSRRFHRSAVEPSPLVDADEELHLRLGYEAEVRCVDRVLGELLRTWDEQARRRAGVVLATSDHGQGLGEHGYPGHGFFLYEEQLHVPLLLRASGVLAPQRVARPTSSVDVARTLLELADCEGPSGLEGQSLTRFLGPHAPAEPFVAERSEWSEFDVAGRGEVQRLLGLRAGEAGVTLEPLTSWVDGSHKLIWNSRTVCELYDLAQDPAEAHNLIDTHRPQAERLREAMELWRAGLCAEVWAESTVSPERLEALRALGY